MTPDEQAELDQLAREVLDSVRYVVLSTIDEDGRTRTSPVYFTPHRYADLYWVSYADTHHSANLGRDDRVSGVVFDSSVPPGPGQHAVYVDGTAREIPADELDEHLPFAFDPERRGGRAFSAKSCPTTPTPSGCGCSRSSPGRCTCGAGTRRWAPGGTGGSPSIPASLEREVYQSHDSALLWVTPIPPEELHHVPFSEEDHGWPDQQVLGC